MDKMLQEGKSDKKWRTAIAEELNCTEKQAKYKVIEKFQKILTSSISNSLVEIDKVKESITFRSTANAFTFFEKISTVFQCNFVVNKLSVYSDVNYFKNCEIHLTEDNILCEIKDTKVDKGKGQVLPHTETKKTQSITEKEEKITDADATHLEDIISSKLMAMVAMAPSEETAADSKAMERSLGEALDLLIKVYEDTQKKLSRKRKHEDKSEEEIHSKNFKKNINSIAFKKETDVDLLITHLEEHLSHEIKTDLEKMIENIPKIKKTFDTIYNFVQIFEKTLRQVPNYKDEHTQEWKVCCKGCLIHCIPNRHFTNPTGRPTQGKLQQ